MMKQAREVLGVKIVWGLQEASTPWAGTSLLVELFRRSGIDVVADKVLPTKGLAKGLKQRQTVESFVLLSALGGERVDDIQHLRDDVGLEGILGYCPPAPETARHWLDGFHDESLMVVRPLQGSFIPPESRPLAGLKEVKRRTIWAYVEAGHLGWDVVSAHSRATATTAAYFLDTLESRMPFPVRAIQVDGGSEFEAIFEEECQRRDIKLFVLPPRSPKLNGGVERAHRTHTEEFYEVTESSFDLARLKDELLPWEGVYNTVRPHQALGYVIPLKFLEQCKESQQRRMCH